MYIIFNQDGSVKHTNLTDFIQKGNDGVNTIFLAIEEKSSSNWNGSVYCELPNGDVEGPIALEERQDEEIGEEQFDGYLFTIGADITAYEGIVKFSLNVVDLNNNSLFTYQTKLTINPSTVVPDHTKITVAQYQSLLQYVASAVGTPDLLKPTLVGMGATSLYPIIGEDDPHTGSRFVVDNNDKAGLYIYGYNNCITLLIVYGVNNNTIYNLPACLKDSQGDFSIEILSYQFERQQAHPEKAYFYIFSKDDIIPTNQLSSLYRIKLF